MTRPCGSSRGSPPVSPPYVYDLRPRRITAVGCRGGNNTARAGDPADVMGPGARTCRLAHAMLSTRSIAPCMGHALPMHLFDYLQDYTSKSG